ncbi:MAG: DUF2284 domain-containing protein [Oscillospiraceae bacterium]|nr:DUF2284 domain-containing protein [Oscillospiraceae bacterium]
MVEKAIAIAIEQGFSHVGRLDVTKLEFLQEVRDMCAADRCHMYNKSWMCPPGCGELSDSVSKAEKYTEGIIVQTTGVLDDVFDYDEMKSIGTRHMQEFKVLRKTLYDDYPSLLALGSGACKVCEQCSYPLNPCRFPDEAIPSMEAYGLFVSKVCEDNGIGYYYGEGTITYTSCILLS